MTIRIAMWSGPRTISTAMMRAWENRADTAVVDEPLYGPYLAETGLDHPGREAVISAQGADWRPIVRALVEDRPGDAAIVYQKHMTHHLLPGMARDWVLGLVNAFLIRDPRAVLASYVETRAEPSLADIGIEAQAEIHDFVAAHTGRAPPVVESSEVQARPEPALRALCAALGVPFDPAMLSWPAGRRASDGVWAPHWYASVEASTGFVPPRAEPKHLPERLAPLAEAALPLYRRLHERRLRF
jgi:hypothetical protein